VFSIVYSYLDVTMNYNVEMQRSTPTQSQYSICLW